MVPPALSGRIGNDKICRYLTLDTYKQSIVTGVGTRAFVRVERFNVGGA